MFTAAVAVMFIAAPAVIFTTAPAVKLARPAVAVASHGPVITKFVYAKPF